MSERGSFVTQYINCKACLAVAKDVLLLPETGGDYVSQQLTSAYFDQDIPVIAGRIKGSRSGEEIEIFEREFVPKLADRICHRIRVAVLADEGERIFTILPPARGSV